MSKFDDLDDLLIWMREHGVIHAEHQGVAITLSAPEPVEQRFDVTDSEPEKPEPAYVPESAYYDPAMYGVESFDDLPEEVKQSLARRKARQQPEDEAEKAPTMP